jgi:hypothetical protein
MSKATDGNVSGGTPADVPDPSQTTLPGGKTNAGPSRIVGSQAKRQEEVTRQGSQKMKWVAIYKLIVCFTDAWPYRFVPTLPVRRKKPECVAAFATERFFQC